MKKTGITIILLALLAVVLVAFGQSGKVKKAGFQPIDPQVV